MLNRDWRRALCACAAMIATGAAAPAAARAGHESGNPINDQGSSYHYRTYVRSITPRAPGLSVEVLEFADRLLLRNKTGKPVTIYGYEGEPYARIQPNGTVEQNVNSPAYYLNTNFYGIANVPASASARAQPKWELVDRTGQFEWHDHRIHWMSPTVPPAVKDQSRKTKIFNWQVPVAVGGKRGAVSGELFWVPESSSAPVAAFVVLGILLVAGVALVIVVRRRRASGGDGDRGPGTKEVW